MKIASFLNHIGERSYLKFNNWLMRNQLPYQNVSSIFTHKKAVVKLLNIIDFIEIKLRWLPT